MIRDRITSAVSELIGRGWMIESCACACGKIVDASDWPDGSVGR